MISKATTSHQAALNVLLFHSLTSFRCSPRWEIDMSRLSMIQSKLSCRVSEALYIFYSSSWVQNLIIFHFHHVKMSGGAHIIERAQFRSHDDSDAIQLTLDAREFKVID